MITRFLLILSLALAPSVALAGTPLTAEQQTFTNPVLNTTAVNVACDANIHNVVTPACASFKLPMAGWTQATLLILYTKGAATELQIATDGGVDMNADGVMTAADLPWAIMQAGNATAVPKITMGDQSLAWDVSGLAGAGTMAKLVTFKDLNADWIRWRITTTAGNGSDSIKIWLIRRGR